MKKSFMCLLILILLLSFSLSAGGQSESGNEVKTITYLTPETDPTAVAMDEMIIARFEAAYPNTKVILDHADLNTVLPKISAQLRGGTAPDVAFFSPRYVNDMVAQNALVPLDDVFAQIGDITRNLVVPTVDGKVYDIPACTESICLYYRTDIFEEAGLEPPTTWEELKEVAKQLTVDTDGDGKIDQYGFGYCGAPGQLGFDFQAISWANGGNLFDENNEVDIDSPEAFGALEFLVEMKEFCPPGIENVDFPELGVQMASGKIAMARGNGRLLLHIERYNQELRGKLGNIAFPAGPMGDTPIVHACINDFVVFNTSKNVDVAKDFVSFYMADEQYLAFIKNATPGHALPVRKAIQDSPDYYAKNVANNNHINNYKDVIKHSIDLVNEYGVDYHMRFPGVVNPHYGKAYSSQIYGSELARAVSGKISAENALANIAEQWRLDYSE